MKSIYVLWGILGGNHLRHWRLPWDVLYLSVSFCFLFSSEVTSIVRVTLCYQVCALLINLGEPVSESFVQASVACMHLSSRQKS